MDNLWQSKNIFQGKMYYWVFQLLVDMITYEKEIEWYKKKLEYFLWKPINLNILFLEHLAYFSFWDREKYPNLTLFTFTCLWIFA